MENKYDYYEPFVKILYKGLDNGFLQSKNDEELYRCQLISKNEFDEIVSAIKNFKKIQIYSRAFLSFTLNEKKSHNFLKPETKDLIPIKFKIKKKMVKLFQVMQISGNFLYLMKKKFYFSFFFFYY